MDTTLQDPYLGRLLDGRYRVESRIARGGMATVYLGVDDRLDREVALKIMHGHLAEDPAFVSRFIREARAAARLSHPNVVQVFDQGADGPDLYLAMEYLPGQTLRDALNERGALSPRQSLSVLEPMLDALAAAHRAGIVHRDIKPENVILTDDGRIKVADFGLARAASAATSASGVLLGTVAYLAPELVARGIADARADVYATGIVLFEMLTGRQPFTGEMPAQIAFRHVHEDVPAPSSLVAWLPQELDVLTRLATARDPDARPPDAGGMLAMTRGAHGRLPAELLDRVAEVPVEQRAAQRSANSDGVTEVVDGPAVPVPHHADTIVGHDLAPARRGPVVVVHPDEDHEEESYQNGPATWLRRGPHSYWWSALLIAVFVLGIGLWWSNAGPGSYAEIPTVADLTTTEAEVKLVEAGFSVAQASAHDDTVAKGHVVESRPRGGDKARKGARVTLVVSLGPEVAPVPTVAKKSVDDATAALADAGFTVGDRIDRYSDSVKEGLVIGTDPKAKSEAELVEPVTLIVSKGPEPVDVPDLVGKSEQEARQALKDLRLKPKISRSFHDDVPQGVVIGQTPEGGRLLPGKTVALNVSKGPDLVEVPDVRDKLVRDAERILERAGFEVEQQGTKLFNRVFQQIPGSGDLRPRGSKVVIITY